MVGCRTCFGGLGRFKQAYSRPETEGAWRTVREGKMTLTRQRKGVNSAQAGGYIDKKNEQNKQVI